MNTHFVVPLLVTILVAFTSFRAEACDSHTEAGTLGPMFGVAGSSSDEVPLLMATTDPNIVGGHVVSVHRDNDGALLTKELNVTIDLSSGDVSAGRPAESTIDIPQAMEDPTLGYRLQLINTTATLSSTTNSSHRAVDIELYAPSYARVASHFLYFFVSGTLNRAYVFYVSEIDCSLPNEYTDCEQSPRGIFEEFWVSIVDVHSGRYVFQPFGQGFGVFLGDPGPHRSLRMVYDDIQVAMVSTNLARRGCDERNSYVFYDENAVVPTERFGQGVLAALQVNERPKDLSAFVIKQTTDDLVRDEESGSAMQFVTEFVVNEVLVLTGELVREVPLDASDLYNLANFDPRAVLATNDSPTRAPTILLPTREPDPILEPTRAPVEVVTVAPTTAFFPTVSPTVANPTVQPPFTLPPHTVPTIMIVGGQELIPAAPTQFAGPFRWQPTIPIGGGEPQQPWTQSWNGVTAWTTSPVATSFVVSESPSSGHSEVPTSPPSTLSPTTALPTTLSPVTVQPSTVLPTTWTQPPLPEGFILLTEPPAEQETSSNVVPEQRPSMSPVRTPVPGTVESSVQIPDGFLLLTPEPIELATGMERTPSPVPPPTASPIDSSNPPLSSPGFLLHLTAKPVGASSPSNQNLRGQPSSAPAASTRSPVREYDLVIAAEGDDHDGDAEEEISLASGQAQPTASPRSYNLVIAAETPQPSEAPVTYDHVIVGTPSDQVGFIATGEEEPISPTRDPGFAAEVDSTSAPAESSPTDDLEIEMQPTKSPSTLSIDASDTDRDADTSEVTAATQPDTSSALSSFSLAFSMLLAMPTIVATVAFV